MADSPAYPGAPRWVKILGVTAAILAAAFLVIHLAGGGLHHHPHLDGSTTSGTPGAGKAGE